MTETLLTCGEESPDRERIRRCGPLSDCARRGHADRLPGVSLEDHIWPGGLQRMTQAAGALVRQA